MDEFDARARAGLLEHVGHVEFDGALGDVQFARDLFVAAAGDEPSEYFALSAGERQLVDAAMQHGHFDFAQALLHDRQVREQLRFEQHELLGLHLVYVRRLLH